MDKEQQLRDDIKTLIDSRQELENADNSGDFKSFSDIGDKLGVIAHRVYLALDVPERSIDKYHSENCKRVLLSPWTVLNRSKSFMGTDKTIDDVEFWLHADMVKTLIDYLLLIQIKEGVYASST